MASYKIHPIAELFPPFSSAEFETLVQDIAANGQREYATTFENKILDGVHRMKACDRLNLKLKTRPYTGKDPLGFASSENCARRHWDESQRAIVAAKLIEFRNGGNSVKSTTSKTETANLRSSDAATLMNVSTRSVETARQVLREAPKKEIKAIEKGETTLGAVAKKLKKAKDDKDTIIDRVGRIVPDELISEWERATQVGRKLQSLAREIKSIVSEGFAGAKQDRIKDPIYAEINNSVISEAEALAWTVGSVIPYAICPTCSGYNRKTCGLCKKRGWVSRFLWNSPAVSEETKRIIAGK